MIRLLLLVALVAVSGCAANSEADTVCMAASRRSLDIAIDKVAVPELGISRAEALARLDKKGDNYETVVRQGAAMLKRKGGCVLMLYMSEDALVALAREELLK